MANSMAAYEAAVAPLKADLFAQLTGASAGVSSVLDIGCGAGPNLKYLSAARQRLDRVVGLDANMCEDCLLGRDSSER